MTRIDIVNELNQYMEESNESQNSIAKKIGVSPATLSRIINGSYPKIDSVAPKIEAFLKVSEKKKTIIGRPEFKHTSISDNVLKVISYCHISKIIGIAYGDAGIGKTEAIKYYNGEFPDAIVINSSPAFARPTGFLKILCKKLRIPVGRRLDDTYIDVIEKLYGTDRVLIIDEAQHLPKTTLELIRSIHDDCEVGVVFVGNHEVFSKMTGKGEATFAQLFSRVGMRKFLLTNHVKIDDINKLFPGLQEEQAKFLLDIARSKWGIRGAVNVYVNSVNNDSLTLKGLKGVASFMGIGER